MEERHSEHRIAERLNADGIPSPGGRLWTGGLVVNRLRNERYAGTLLYNRTTQKLKTPTRHNPPEEWIRTPHAFEGIISEEQFQKAQELLLQRRKKYNPDRMLESLEALIVGTGCFAPRCSAAKRAEHPRALTPGTLVRSTRRSRGCTLPPTNGPRKPCWTIFANASGM